MICKHQTYGICHHCALHHPCPFDDFEQDLCKDYEAQDEPEYCANWINGFCSIFGSQCCLSIDEQLDCENYESELDHAMHVLETMPND